MQVALLILVNNKSPDTYLIIYKRFYKSKLSYGKSFTKTIVQINKSDMKHIFIGKT